MNRKTLFVTAAAAVALIISLGLLAENGNGGKIVLYGNIDIRQADIGFMVGGTLKEMFFEEGERVKKGDLLAVLDDRDYRHNYQRALAEIDRAEAQLAEARSVLATNLPLCKQKIASERSCISYTNAKNEAEAALQSAKIAAAYEKDRLGYTRIHAPDDGIVSIRVREPGTVLAAGETVYTIAKDKPRYARIYLPEPYLGLVTHGSRALIVTDGINPADGKKISYGGYVGYISPVAEFTPKTVQTDELRSELVYRLNVYAEAPDDLLKQGMPVTVIIEPEAPEAADGKNAVH